MCESVALDQGKKYIMVHAFSQYKSDVEQKVEILFFENDNRIDVEVDVGINVNVDVDDDGCVDT